MPPRSPARVAADMHRPGRARRGRRAAGASRPSAALADALPAALEEALEPAPRAAGSRGRRWSGTGSWSWCPRCGRRSRWPTGGPRSISRSWPTAPSGSRGSVRHAGAIFLGDDTPEPVGDYLAGPSHVLPTAGTARYASPLGVYDFVKRTSVIRYSAARLAADADAIIALAEAEGLHGHAEAVRIRVGQLSFRPWPSVASATARVQPAPPPRWAGSWAVPGAHRAVHGGRGGGRVDRRLAGAAGRCRAHAHRRRRAGALAAHRLDRPASGRSLARPTGTCAGRSWPPW